MRLGFGEIDVYYQSLSCGRTHKRDLGCPNLFVAIQCCSADLKATSIARGEEELVDDAL